MKNLELYIHIPFCVKKCSYCDFLSFVADDNDQAAYIKALIREIKYFAPKCSDYQVSSIFIGGGTPSWLEAERIKEVMDEIKASYNIAPDVEVSMECNPGTVTADKLRIYKSIGINRLSIGLQSTFEDELKELGRIHTFDQFLKTFQMARTYGIKNINVDLMSGLPRQTAEKFVESLKKVIRLKPEHISVYSLIIEKGTPFYDRYKFDATKQQMGLETEILPSEDEVYRAIKMTQYVLREAGYEQYEISNFARKGYECRHNVGYWTRENYLGLGLGSASLMENVRYTNTRDFYKYIEGTVALQSVGDEEFATNIHSDISPVSRQAQMEEFMFLGLRMNKGISRNDFQEYFRSPIECCYKEQIDELKAQGLMEARAGRIYLTDRGMDLSNYCMEKFLL